MLRRNKPGNKLTNESIVPPRAAEMHLQNHRYWWTVSKETQSNGLQWELKVENLKIKKNFFKVEKILKSCLSGRGKTGVNTVEDNWRVSWG